MNSKPDCLNLCAATWNDERAPAPEARVSRVHTLHTACADGAASGEAAPSAPCPLSAYEEMFDLRVNSASESEPVHPRRHLRNYCIRNLDPELVIS